MRTNHIYIHDISGTRRSLTLAMSDAFVLKVLRRKQQVLAVIMRRINQPIKAYLMPRLQTMYKS
nr:hypothetical protein P5627_08235 [Bacillus safensis]